MESSWQPNYPSFSYYDPSRPERPESNDAESESHRRPPGPPSNNGNSNFLPPPPPHTATPSSGHMALPPFSQAFYTSPSSHAYSQPSSGPGQGGGMNFPSGGHYGSLPSYGHGGYPLASPVGNMAPPLPSSQRPYDVSPRMNHAGPTGYSSSPNLPGGMRHLSPTSPTAHMNLPGISASTSSSSSYPSTQKGNAPLPKGKRRSKSMSQEEDWEDADGRFKGGVRMSGLETDEQPWGMPQSEYKALNPRDKKQVRNRIGARRFRAKRKDYVQNLETSLRIRDDENAQLRQTLESYRTENNELRQRLGMPALPPLPPPAVLNLDHDDDDGEGLGLVVQQGEWEDRKDG